MRHGGLLLFALGLLVTACSVVNGQSAIGNAIARTGTLADAASRVSVLRGDNTIEFVTCVSNSSWRRPTLEEQEWRLLKDERYGVFEDDQRERYVASFWREGGELDPQMVDLSGLWRIQDAGLDVMAIAKAGCPNFKNPQGRSQLNLWLLGYQADAVEMASGRVLVQVRRKDIGFQTIEVLLPRGTKINRLRVDFIDQEGRVLETIDPDASWSQVALKPGEAAPPARQRPTGAVNIVPGSRTELRDALLAPPPVLPRR